MHSCSLWIITCSKSAMERSEQDSWPLLRRFSCCLWTSIGPLTMGWNQFNLSCMFGYDRNMNEKVNWIKQSYIGSHFTCAWLKHLRRPTDEHRKQCMQLASFIGRYILYAINIVQSWKWFTNIYVIKNIFPLHGYSGLAYFCNLFYSSQNIYT